ncbi:MAG: NifB/NifX family molybdenum-iron cluster-binding protein [Fibrobacterota bacterium]
MKIAISSDGTGPEDPVQKRFGRAKNFVIYSTEDETYHPVANTQSLNAAQGAGIQSAQRIVENGAEVLISGHCGPKAFAVLKQAGVRIYTLPSASVGQAVEMYLSHTLTPLDDADVEGHWV